MLQKAIQWTATLLIAYIFIFSFGTSALASPSVTECAENPELEGCSSEESTNENETSPEQSVPMADSGDNPSMLWNIIKLIFALLLVLALIYGLLKFFNKRNKVFQKNRTMETLGGITLAPSRSMQAVRIGDKVFVVGVGDSVELITEITDDATKESLMNQEEQQDFINKGIKRIRPKKKQDDSSINQSSTVQFQQLFEKQLSDMKKKRQRIVKREDDQS
ncbi:flagellar biosynthetic protein FliO [Halobacillus seohaensis]|uniref:Flagellar biosynthetic protein FliO n=1 Tax=Halobacillus seohaensis TaxID=447421 RepID=A0ABW2EFV0_9BACI